MNTRGMILAAAVAFAASAGSAFAQGAPQSLINAAQARLGAAGFVEAAAPDVWSPPQRGDQEAELLARSRASPVVDYRTG